MYPWESDVTKYLIRMILKKAVKVCILSNISNFRSELDGYSVGYQLACIRRRNYEKYSCIFV